MGTTDLRTGLKRIRTGQILSIAGTILGLIVYYGSYLLEESFIDVSSLNSLQRGLYVSMGLAVLVIPVISIIAFVFIVSGLLRSAKSEHWFRTALLFAALQVFVLVIAVFGGDVSAGWMTSVLSLLQPPLEYLIMLFVIKAVSAWAERTHNREPADAAAGAAKPITVLFAAIMLLIVEETVFNRLTGGIPLSMLQDGIRMILILAVRVRFLRFIDRARTALS